MVDHSLYRVQPRLLHTLCILLPTWYNRQRRRNGKKKKKKNCFGYRASINLTTDHALSLQRILIFQRLSSSLSRVSLLMTIHGLIDTRLDRSSITCFSMEKFHGSLTVPMYETLYRYKNCRKFFRFSFLLFLEYKLTISN